MTLYELAKQLQVRLRLHHPRANVQVSPRDLIRIWYDSNKPQRSPFADVETTEGPAEEYLAWLDAWNVGLYSDRPRVGRGR